MWVPAGSANAGLNSSFPAKHWQSQCHTTRKLFSIEQLTVSVNWVRLDVMHKRECRRWEAKQPCSIGG